MTIARSSLRSLALLVPPLFWSACASGPAPAPARPFEFERDVFAYENELIWEYVIDPESGRMEGRPRAVPVEFGQRCALMARATRQFRHSARFAPEHVRVDPEAYWQLIRDVLATNMRRETSAPDPIVIPGYPDLRGFSRDYEDMFKAELGGPWRSYVQRGNWRMIFPFSPRHQRRTALDLVRSIERSHLPIVHLVRYPKITINHTLLLFAGEETPTEIVFRAYDPNRREDPVSLHYDRATARFDYPATPYFAGGPVDVYQIYDGLLY